jgi:hypothetical protein
MEEASGKSKNDSPKANTSIHCITHMRTMVLEYAHQHLPEQNHPVL